jgi:hypothetical protein
MKTLHLKTEKTHRFATSLSEQRSWFNPTVVHAGFVVDKAAIGRILLCVLRFSLFSIIPATPHKHFISSIAGEVLY